mgnify:CR=1 FL=1
MIQVEILTEWLSVMDEPDPRGSAIATVAIADGKDYEQLSNDWQKWQYKFRSNLNKSDIQEVENEMNKRVYLLRYADAKRLKIGPYADLKK